MKLTYIS